MKKPVAAKTASVELPKIEELATLYKAAKRANDDKIAGVIEASVLRISAAESAAVEATVLTQFARGSR